MAGVTDWFADSFRAEFERQNTALGRVNLAIFGKTGVGKSTLVNAVFGREVARTGIGEPVTRGSHLYVERTGSLGIVDTQGLEIGRDDKEISKELEKTIRESRRLPLTEQIHLAWFCVRGMDRRFEESEAAMIGKLDDLGVPVVLILTQVPMRDGHFHPDAIELARQIEARKLPIAGGRAFMTFAMADQFSGQQPYGLREVLDASFRVAPEGVHAALNAAQEIDLARKAKAAQVLITSAAGAAAAAAASPIPFSSATLLVPIQLGMMARLAQLYKIKYQRAALMAVASSTAATQVGRAAFTNLLKLIPGAGTVAGGVIGAGVASSFTFTMGHAWLAVCQRVADGKLAGVGGALDTDAVRDMFQAEFRKRAGGLRHRDESTSADRTDLRT